MKLCERHIRLDKRFFYNFVDMLASVMIHTDVRRILTWSFSSNWLRTSARVAEGVGSIPTRANFSPFFSFLFLSSEPD